MTYRILHSLCLVMMLSACATPTVETSAPAFDQETYATDLNGCRGGNILVASAKAVGIAMLGSAYGLLEGAVFGARTADNLEEAAIGAAVGGTIGLTAGAIQAIDNHEAQIAGCMADKGYYVTG